MVKRSRKRPARPEVGESTVLFEPRESKILGGVETMNLTDITLVLTYRFKHGSLQTVEIRRVAVQGGP